MINSETCFIKRQSPSSQIIVSSLPLELDKDMSKFIRVPIAGWGVGKGEVTLYTVVGSCIAIMLYDPVKKIGGMIHIMLGFAKNDLALPSKYADTGIPFLLSKMIEAGASVSRLQAAKIVGGGNMFEVDKKGLNVSEQNILTVRSELNKRNIKIIYDECGGNVGRRIEFFVNDGQIIVEPQLAQNT